jgi:hypothetical protein
MLIGKEAFLPNREYLSFEFIDHVSLKCLPDIAALREHFFLGRFLYMEGIFFLEFVPMLRKKAGEPLE